MTHVSVALRPLCWCPAKGHQHGVSIQMSIYLGETLFRMIHGHVIVQIFDHLHATLRTEGKMLDPVS